MTARREARGGVLVAGGGFAGGYVARLLGRRGATIVSPENFMLYTPLLPEAASGTLEPRHVVVPLRQMCPHAEMLLGRVTAIDAEQRTAHVETPDGRLVRRRLGAPGACARRRRSDAPGTRTRRARGRVQGPRRTRSTSATTSCESSRLPTPSSIPRAARRTCRSSSSVPATRGSRRSPSSPTSSPTQCASTRASARRDSAGCSSTRRRRSCPRSRRGWASTRRGSSHGAGSRSTSRRRSSR